MRVSDSMIFDSAALYADRAREQTDAATAVASTGLKLVHASDDPAAAALAVSHDLGAKRLDAILSGMGSAQSELQTADGALSTVTNVFARAKELAVQMANDSMSAADRSAAATEVQQLVGEAVSALNTKVGSRFLFSGTRTDAASFDANGVYQGDAGVRRIEVAPGVYQQVSVDAGGLNAAMATLQSLSKALTQNDVAGIQSALTGLDGAVNQVAGMRAQAGAQIGGLDAATAAGTVARDGEKKQLSQLTDADAVDAATHLAFAQRGLEAALSAAAQSFKLTLLDKLG